MSQAIATPRDSVRVDGRQTAPSSVVAPIPARIRAPVTYTVPQETKPQIHTAALTGGDPVYLVESEARTVTITNARPGNHRLSLDQEGVVLRQAPSAVGDFLDPDHVAAVYDPEIVTLLKRETGARDVVIFDRTLRTDASRTDGDAIARGPARRVHNDYTDWSGRQRVRDLLGTAFAEAHGSKRVVQMNVWRPLKGPVLRAPLAFIDAGSLAAGDLIAMDQVYPDRVGEIYHVAYNPDHRWLYFPHMTQDEVVLIKGYDSLTDGRARFTPHVAIDDPTSPPDAPARESIEVRTLLLFDR